jgi:hypothetical protein
MGNQWSGRRLKEHQRHIRLEHPDKSAVAEHSIELGHRIQLQNELIGGKPPVIK